MGCDSWFTATIWISATEFFIMNLFTTVWNIKEKLIYIFEITMMKNVSLRNILIIIIYEHFKGYLRYKMITSQNVSSEAQIKNFFIS